MNCLSSCDMLAGFDVNSTSPYNNQQIQDYDVEYARYKTNQRIPPLAAEKLRLQTRVYCPIPLFFNSPTVL